MGTTTQAASCSKSIAAKRGASWKGRKRGEDLEEDAAVQAYRSSSAEQLAQILINKLFKGKSPEGENAVFLSKLRSRLDKAGVRLPTVEVRYENYSVIGETHVGRRALPTLCNGILNTIEACLTYFHIPVSRKAKIHILSEVSGIIKPGRMTLVLGPPKSGKTSFLLSLAGKLDPSLKVRGKITYNGYEMHEFEPRRTSAYISQVDQHVAEMTVRETLLYSAQSQGVGPTGAMLAELLHKENELNIRPDTEVDVFMKARATPEYASHLLTEYTLKILGLDTCADIMVGNHMKRGISRGQKKRLTTGEMMVGPAKTFFMDEISTGLDSSTTQQMVSCLRNICHSLENTIVMSILQPSPETFSLFDDVIILAEGQIVYHGDRADVLEFFEDCGFQCPERKATADFLQEVTAQKDQEQYWANKNQSYQFVTVSQFGQAFRTKFQEGVRMNKELEVPFDKTTSQKGALSFKSHATPGIEIWRNNFSKECLLMRRNFAIYLVRFTKVLVSAIMASTIYYHTEMSRNNLKDAQLYASAIFYAIYTMLISGYSEVVFTIHRLPVFFKQRDLLFLPAWAFTTPKAVLNIPVSLVEATIWTAVTYYTSGFSPASERFLQHWLLFFLIHQMASTLFLLLAAICRKMVLAATAGTCTILLFFVCGGFLIPRTRMEPWSIWAYWISPMSFAQNGLSAVEFLAPEWRKTTEGSNDTLGVQHMRNNGLFPVSYWYWIAIGVLFGYTFLFQLLYTVALTFLKPLNSPQAIVPEEAAETRESGGKLGSERVLSLTKRLTSQRSLTRSFSTNSRYGLISANQAEGELQEAANPALQMYKASLTKICSEASLAKLACRSVRVKHGMILPFRPLTFTFRNISYFVDMPAAMRKQGATKVRLQLLDKVTGCFRPGILTALVGVSGAGKTTLLDVLAGRTTGGYTEGDIHVGGYKKKQATFSRIFGYCEQDDIHSSQLTVFESLVYSAWLRLPNDVELADKKQFVHEVMNLVELETIRNALVGLAGVSGLSIEQRKRLTIAVELVGNPSIIFMDEPTSGLDARAAAIVMRTVRNTVDTGRTVVCTVHQPSVDILESFDEVLFLKTGGQVIYAGPLGKRSEHLINYFESIDGVPEIHEDSNPATWMLEITNTVSEIRLGVDFADIYKNSELFLKVRDMVDEMSKPGRNLMGLSYPRYSRSLWSQTCLVLWKFHLTYWRLPAYNNSRFFLTAIFALIFGTVFWDFASKRDTEQNLFSIMGAVYGSTFFLGIMNASTVQPIVSAERIVFYRERAAGMYCAIPYGLSQVLIEIPYCLIQSVLYSFSTYAMMGLEWTVVKFFSYFFFYFFTYYNFTLYGMLAVAITPNEQMAFILATFVYGWFNLFAGFLIPKPRIPGWWSWAYWCCPLAYTLYGITVSQFGDVNEMMTTTDDGTQMEIANYIHKFWGYKHSFLPITAAIVAGFSIVLAFLFINSIRCINFQRK